MFCSFYLYRIIPKPTRDLQCLLNYLKVFKCRILNLTCVCIKTFHNALDCNKCFRPSYCYTLFRYCNIYHNVQKCGLFFLPPEPTQFIICMRSFLFIIVGQSLGSFLCHVSYQMALFQRYFNKNYICMLTVMCLITFVI